MSLAPNIERGAFGRRAFGFLFMSALLPGSVQRYAGNRLVGKIAFRLWLAVVTVFLLLLLGFWLFPGTVVGIFLTPWVATSCKVLLWLFFLGWLALLVDSWRLARPNLMPQKIRLAMTISVLLIAIISCTGAVFASNALTAASNVGQVLPGGGDTEAKQGRYNFLLLGVDAAKERVGVRPDSVNVASIDIQTGQTVIFGLPRNMEKVPFPKSSPMHQLYPNGFQCPHHECMLNAIWTKAEDHKKLFKDGEEPGLVATRDAVSEVLGLEINYFVIVDMHGFQSVIDAMGGIRLDVMKPIPIGGGTSKISGYVKPGKNVLLDGRHALWFARSRAESSDYERMQRQKCVLNAIAKQMDAQTIATRFLELSQAGKDMVQTDVPRDQIVDLAKLAGKVRNTKIAAVNFAPPVVPDTSNPDFAMIRKTVQSYIRNNSKNASTASSAPKPKESATKQTSSRQGSVHVNPEAYEHNTPTRDLGKVCAASE